MGNRIILFILGYIVWMLLTWPPDAQHLFIGIFVALFVSYMTGEMFVKRPGAPGNLKRYIWFGYYIPLFLWECLKANIDVAYRVSHHGVPIRPGIVKIKTNLKSDTALTFLANSITLTPGTLCVDVDRDRGYLYVHWIDVKTEDIDEATRLIAGKFERVLKEIFE